MTDTIDLLEVIGQDASLRHASGEELMSLLEQAQASEGLTAAIACGDTSLLLGELGLTKNQAPQVVQNPGREEEEEEEQEDPLDSPASLVSN
jgi:hypothetical protein